MASQSATTMPGGAKLARSTSGKTKRSESSGKSTRATASRSCKYGERLPDGTCPKKPKKPRKPKKPCKYGPRTADGLCPKKPSTYSGSSSSGESSPSWLDKPIPQGPGKRKTTARKYIEKTAEDVAKKAADETFEAAKTWYNKPENRAAFATGAAGLAQKLKSFVPLVGAVLAAAWAAKKATRLTAQRLEQDAQNYASLAIANTTRLAKRALTIPEMTTLRDFYRKQFLNSYNLRFGK